MAMSAPMSLAATVVIAVVTLTIGILIGHFGIPRSPEKEEIEKLKIMDQITASHYTSGDDITKRIIDNTDAESIRKNSRFLSETPHLAGTPRDNELAQHIQQLWLEQGLDKSDLVPYKVLLSYPDLGNPNKVYIVDNSRNAFFTSTHQEEVLHEGDGHPQLIHSYHGYSPKGDVTGDPIYAHYCRLEDFEHLESQSLSAKGKICICRYGKIYRGNKVRNAAAKGAIGVLMYSDPDDVARNGTSAENVYPNSWWMPGTAMQRGSVYVNQGDPLTPGYPAVDGAFRLDINDVDIPKIPSQPIGYRDARRIMEILGGRQAPSNWTGGLGITYRLGPGFDGQRHRDKRLRLIVNNQLRTVNVQNVIGIIEGEVEPDRYVIMGNHRDSWGYGALDAVTGTSSLLEVTRVLGELKKNGWRPRRTLVFCSWAAEEFALIGSTEWVLEHVHKIMGRAVASINMDTCVKGPIFDPDASPSLMDVVRRVAQEIPDPRDESKSVYEKWQAYRKEQKPQIDTLESGTDHAAFAFYAGVPSINLDWTFDKKEFPISAYPAYHTGYETFYLVDNYVDPGFKIHRTCARMAGVLSHILADSTLLPYNFVEMAERMTKSFDELKKKGKLRRIEERHFNNLGRIETALTNFTTAAEKWHEKLKEIDTKNPLIVRQINDQMMGLERVFIKPDGLPDRLMIRHVAFAPSEHDKYSKAAFPAITDLLHDIDQLQADQRSKRWKEIERHLSDIMIIIQMATSFLEPSSEL